MDPWLEAYPLKESVPAIFKISNLKHGSLFQFIHSDPFQNNCAWDLHLKRDPNTAEIPELMQLLGKIREPPELQDHIDDSRSWLAASNNKFSVKSMYEALVGKEDGLFFPKKSERNKRVFEDKDETAHSVTIGTKALLARWFAVYYPDVRIDFGQWIFYWDSVIDAH
ncbi:hypothetical protein BVC80_409g6 [Macleaya cordata]|uniref:Uncharacterized protein n=1 Tax=Macleaya cordata TaxID=56857 RepID=A0A200PMI0_MACCD|nr:hypothetical protein BVC80_409g6 [Macleaya cordata]